MPEPALTLDEVRKLADLARLALSDQDLSAMRSDLARVLEHMDQLRALDVDHLEPLAGVANEPAQPAPDSPDSPGVPITRAQFAGMAPSFDDPFLLVPKVLGGEDPARVLGGEDPARVLGGGGSA